MKNDKSFNASRRLVMKRGVGMAATVLAAGVLLKSRVAEAAKAAKSEMGYQNKPLGKAQCSSCVHFAPGPKPSANGTCNVVAGSISPHGWCVAFTHK